MVVVEVGKGGGGFRERCWASNSRTSSSGGAEGLGKVGEDRGLRGWATP